MLPLKGPWSNSIEKVLNLVTKTKFYLKITKFVTINLFRQFYYDFRKKILDQNGPYISTFQTNLKNACLSVILEFCLSSSLLSSVVCVLAPAYTSLCIGLKYLPKVMYIILFDPLWASFFIFESVFVGRSATLPYVWKYITKTSTICVWKHLSSPNFYWMYV